jgi:hypothetical protein
MVAKKEINIDVYILQAQFVLVIFHASQLFFIDCDYPKLWAWIICAYAVVFLYLFADFYKQAYRGKQPSKVRSGILYYNVMLLCCLCVCFAVLLHKQQYTPFPVTVGTMSSGYFNLQWLNILKCCENTVC